MEKLKLIAGWLEMRGIDLYYVGGCVRDEIMELPVEDIDICIVGGRTADTVQFYLELFLISKQSPFDPPPNTGLIESITSVYGDFPIWIVEIDGIKYEFAMARKERKTGQSHQDFITEVRDVTIEEDLLRRDLTINAIAKNVLTGKLVDPYGGIDDIKDKIASPISEAFKEDPLRVIRVARFIARFDLTPTPTLIEMCKELGAHGISNERVGMELMKTLKQAKSPSKFFYFLKEVGWLDYHFREVYDLIGVPQSPKHHPEGDVFTHTMYCIDAVPQGDWFMRVIMLCHDLGKATHTTVDNVPWDDKHLHQAVKDTVYSRLSEFKIASAGHESAGVPLTRSLLQRISFCDHNTIRKIACLVELHMTRSIITANNYDKIVRRTLRRLMHYDLTYDKLIRVTYFDLSGRPPRVAPTFDDLCLDMFLDTADVLVEDGHMIPIVDGEKLLNLGFKEGPIMGKIIKHALELQDRGTLNKDNWLKVLKGSWPKEFKELNVN
jgi:tRNA nucleotidyltransferase (CCA-adding enzyme)